MSYEEYETKILEELNTREQFKYWSFEDLKVFILEEGYKENIEQFYKDNRTVDWAVDRLDSITWIYM